MKNTEYRQLTIQEYLFDESLNSNSRGEVKLALEQLTAAWIFQTGNTPKLKN